MKAWWFFVQKCRCFLSILWIPSSAFPDRPGPGFPLTASVGCTLTCYPAKAANLSTHKATLGMQNLPRPPLYLTWVLPFFEVIACCEVKSPWEAANALKTSSKCQTQSATSPIETRAATTGSKGDDHQFCWSKQGRDKPSCRTEKVFPFRKANNQPLKETKKRC